ncbi:hypothetical protein [Serratia liquefaciens]|uniref:hypothetical protein n=1 Tax=Serratia liquefaciens TaxID=614 RepID=UPI00301D8FA9
MKERPVIFNSEMVRAILSGRKTQTRRAISDRHLHLLDVASQVGECYPLESGIDHANSQSYYREHCPFGQVGDLLWVRETWAEAGASAPDLTLYRANYPAHVPASYENVPAAEEIRWRPSIHMPRWASRILLEITAVRVERLNSISEGDAKAEGYPVGREVDGGAHDPWLWFRELWDGIYPDNSFKVNPWVWVIEFKRVEATNG